MDDGDDCVKTQDQHLSTHKNVEVVSPGGSIIGSPSPFSKGITRVPLQRIRCGELDIRSEERWLEYEALSTRLKFLHKDRKHFDHSYCTLADCKDISAVDLRVSAKFGYLDAMSGTLIIECRKVIDIASSHGCVSTAVCLSRSFVLEATFHVNYTGQVRDVLRSLRHAKQVESATESEIAGNENERTPGVPSMAIEDKKLREGLPDWTPYIPHRVYTPAVRRIIELIITLYTIFSILWALWQLYRHVDFIRAYIQPFVDALKYHVELMDQCFRVLNSLFEEMTNQWFAYLKPGYVILSSFATPLIAVAKELWSLICSISLAVAFTFQPLFQFFQPVFKVLYLLLIKTPYTIFQPAFSFIAKCGRLFYNGIFCHVVLAQFSNIKGLFSWLVEILEKSMKLDPLKAQLILMRSNVINSGKALSLGLVYIFKTIERRVWLMIARPVDDKDD
ncbi:uncharacterized protein [Montipora foliosa]|uniref:uncharacterized protein n=1 Tax=Montipora foliosa TaxID=591990 RepID=UPI0035F1BCD8